VGPGTIGSLGALLPVVAVHATVGLRPWQVLIPFALLLAPGIWASTRYSRATGRKDPSAVVVDEVLGQWLSLAGATHFNIVSFAAGFVLFRLFDIVKPPPVRQMERFSEGLGIVADDLMAGLYAALVLFLAGCFNLY
jgi:phosphatidylglycerophosphatase A